MFKTGSVHVMEISMKNRWGSHLITLESSWKFNQSSKGGSWYILILRHDEALALSLGRICRFIANNSKFHSHRIHGTGIFTYIWLIFMVNVGRYTSPMDPIGLVSRKQTFWDTLPKTNIAQDYFPFGMADFQGRTVKFPGSFSKDDTPTVPYQVQRPFRPTARSSTWASKRALAPLRRRI